VNKLHLHRLPLRALRLGHPEGNPLFTAEEMLAKHTRAAGPDAPVAEQVWAALPWVPRAAQNFTGRLLRREDVIRHLGACPPAAYYALTNAGGFAERFAQLASVLEPAILADGDTLVLYLSWAQQLKVPLPLPFAQYRAALIRDPLPGIVWALSVGDKDFAADLLQWAAANVGEYAAAAWAVAVAEAMDPEPFRPVLSLNPKYAVAAAATFGMRFGLEDFQAPVDGRWLYHLLANDGCEDPDQAERELLALDPGWGLEWLIERNKTTDSGRLAAVIGAMRRWGAGHPLYELILPALAELSRRKRGGEDAAPRPTGMPPSQQAAGRAPDPEADEELGDELDDGLVADEPAQSREPPDAYHDDAEDDEPDDVNAADG
jgi:hypothetical protein